jgi:hypothetical protein
MSSRYLRVMATTIALGVIPWLGTSYIVDPYHFRRGWHPRLGEEEFAKVADYRLFQLRAFRKSPKPNVILGDSRSLRLDPSLFDGGESQWANVSYGGGSASEEISTFRLLSRTTRLKTVIFSLPFNIYSANFDSFVDLVEHARLLLDNPVAYYSDPGVLKTSLMVLAAKVGNENATEAPPMSPEEFWNFQLTKAADAYSAWKQPVVLDADIPKVISYCRTHGIRLFIFIPPTHIDLQNIVGKEGLTAQYAAYKRRVRSWGVPVFDFDVPNELTRNRANFSDPYHFKKDIAPQLVREMYRMGLQP